jgi:hypothetical protein
MFVCVLELRGIDFAFFCIFGEILSLFLHWIGADLELFTQCVFFGADLKNMHYKLLSKPKTLLSEIASKNINVNRKLYLLSISLNKSRICIVKRI